MASLFVHKHHECSNSKYTKGPEPFANILVHDLALAMQQQSQNINSNESVMPRSDEGCMHMPNSLYNKIWGKLSKEEFKRVCGTCKSRPKAPTEKSLCEFIDRVMGKTSNRQELKDKIPLIRLVLRLYRSRTYSRSGLNTFSGDRMTKYSVQLVRRNCRSEGKSQDVASNGFKVSLSFEYNAAESTFKAELSNDSSFLHVGHDHIRDWNEDLPTVQKIIHGTRS